MKKIFFCVLITGTLNFAFGQITTEYRLHSSKADSLVAIKKYKEASIEFQKAFDANDGRATLQDRYNAACMFALTNEEDKAFYHLFYLSDNPRILYRHYDHLTTDTDLNSLHQSEKWVQLVEKVKANKEEYEKDFDYDLIAKLDTIRDDDQKYRRQIDEIEEKYGKESEEVKSHWRLIEKVDSINLIKVREILDNKGWLGANIIDNKGNTTLFLVIQHSDIGTQEKYLPMMKDAVEKGNASASGLAMLEDRIALRKGQKQIYGSQIGYDKEKGEYYVLPLIEPENVNDRRKEVKLGSLENYVSRWGIKWNAVEYMEKLPMYEEMQKEK